MKIELHRIKIRDLVKGYSDDPDRIYGVEFAGFDIRFQVQAGTLTVCEVVPAARKE